MGVFQRRPFLAANVSAWLSLLPIWKIPFYLFDEWASDQDPYFKNIFYTQLLPELKTRGKCVLVITHDDKYFDLADRVIKLDYGKLAVEADESPQSLVPVFEAK